MFATRHFPRRRLAKPSRDHGAAFFGEKLLSIYPRTTSAFTLLEIMIVVAVMLIVVTMGIPAIYSAAHRDPMTQTIKDVTEACRVARSQAIISGNTTAMRIYPPDRRITVDAPQAASAKAADAAGGDAPTNAAVGGFSAEISDRLTIEMLDVNFLDCRSWDSAVVYFNPNGTSDEFNLVVQGEDGERRRIALDIATAIPDVTPLR